MVFWKSSKQANNPPRHKQHKRVRPIVNQLEDRTTPALFCGPTVLGDLGIFGGGSSTAAATHIQVVTPNTVNAGNSFDVVIKALTASNLKSSSYTGTVHLSLGTADAAAVLPADYTFTAGDRGTHVFHVALGTAGSQMITAADTVTAISGSAATTVNSAPIATQLFVRISDHVVPGVPTNVSVSALDASGRPVRNYVGAVNLTSSDTGATLPATYTFTAADHGRHVFQVTFANTGSKTVTAADATLTGAVTTTVDVVGPVTHFSLQSFGAGLAGFASPVQVVALDANNRIVAGYTGTVRLNSSDTAATLPADYTFVAADHGSHVLSVTFATAGRQTLTATDTAAGLVVGSQSFWIVSQFGGGYRHHGWW